MVFGKTHTGIRRKENEDNFVAEDVEKLKAEVIETFKKFEEFKEEIK